MPTEMQDPVVIKTPRGDIIVNAPQSRPRGMTDYNLLKARQEEIGNQLESVQDRREELSQQLNSKSGADRAGVEQRIGVLDARLSGLEADLADVGRQLANAAPASMAVPPPRIIRQGFDDGDLVASGFIGAAIMLALFVPFLLRGFRRRGNLPTGSGTPLIEAAKIDRMEQAIDSIAVEIERVSENQRFMTRLMTETQLAGTLAAVRDSTEAARAAAESPANV